MKSLLIPLGTLALGSFGYHMGSPATLKLQGVVRPSRDKRGAREAPEVQLFLGIHGLVPAAPVDTKIYGYLSPLHEMVDIQGPLYLLPALWFSQIRCWKWVGKFSASPQLQPPLNGNCMSHPEWEVPSWVLSPTDSGTKQMIVTVLNHWEGVHFYITRDTWECFIRVHFSDL